MKTVFISHKSDDAHIAKGVKEEIQSLNQYLPKEYQVDVFVAREDLNPGSVWFTELIEKAKACDYLMLLYTDIDADWTWCTYEAGLFLGTKGNYGGNVQDKQGVSASRRDLIFLCHASQTESELPGPFGHYKHTRATQKELTSVLKTIILGNCNVLDDAEFFVTTWWESTCFDSEVERVAANIIELGFSSESSKTYHINNYISVKAKKTGETDEASLTITGAKGNQIEEIFGEKVDKLQQMEPAKFTRMLTENYRFKSLERSLDKIKNEDSRGGFDFSNHILESGGAVYAHFPYKDSLKTTGSKNTKMLFFLLNSLTVPIVRFRDLMDEVTFLISSGEKIHYIARTPALGCLAQPSSYGALQDAILEHAANITMTTSSETKLEEFHWQLVGEELEGGETGIISNETRITNEDAVYASAQSLVISSVISEHNLSDNLADIYLFVGINAAIMVNPFFPNKKRKGDEKEKIRHVKMYGFKTYNRTIISELTIMVGRITKKLESRKLSCQHYSEEVQSSVRNLMEESEANSTNE